ncbi:MULTISPECIES: glycoside hydrolase family 32 protein [Metabacillus]|uniref:Glycoside hydrolase family 32 protein n=1 Tax=Metabacillus hrfriensis TaxID=3048891 RepID=A0ACD4R9A0_9BACI|nr:MULTISPECIES: glycoside hydrolase family 32 protein [Metabacillus]UAL51515.1 glycoside hydrolase family 32 protein [Metabacillus dongyingensis]UOK57422.1 glycoside hydrolase family 32 protein [Bacillus sp. OVS6]USK27819.1 glycoside hydrolase family 32 protein [Bacillus sp. CMF21]WHZ57026.1 glycoside hydrolase family 32 protein [Metabacillus sp. CT-WN-B3]
MKPILTEKYRPHFHFSPLGKWLNDPNGMVFFNGEYHLFYQHHPFSTIWGPMHWGHAVSKDLIHWEHLPVALHPDEHGAIFSGSAVVDWDNTTGFFDDQPGLVAIYTSHDSYPDSERPRQRQCIAYSKDNGRSWTKYSGNPVLIDETKTDYRDPKVFWHSETKHWIMVLATGQSVTIYKSINLINWQFASEFGEGSHAGFWECPDLFPLKVDGDKVKWVMLVSLGDTGEHAEGSWTQYFIGDFDGETFINDHDKETVLWLDYGRDNYAGVSWSDMPSSDGRRIYIGWMSNWRYANQVPTKEWRGVMTIPRELSLASSADGVRIIQKPVSEARVLRKRSNTFKDKLLTPDQPLSIPLESTLLELNLEVEFQDASIAELTIQHSDSEKTVIRYDAEAEILSADRTLSGESDFSSSFPAVQAAPLKMKKNGVRLQLLLDASSIELFGNDGECAITSLVFPSSEKSELHLAASGGSIKVKSFELHELSSIWNKEG